jgi:hypothetical protein
MKTLFTPDRIDYTGRELRSHWIMERFGLVGDAGVGFIGACSVRGEDLVDLEDRTLGNTVEAERMLHFIVEIFGLGMPGAVFAQRLLCAVAGRIVEHEGNGEVAREGDDLYVGDGKLSVSVATVSPVSCLIHLGLNVSDRGVPVKAACLNDLGIAPERLAPMILSGFAGEVAGVREAAQKVRPVL